ncbi:RNA-directed DNA polymerase, eukaryota [Tanacetum coccineum]
MNSVVLSSSKDRWTCDLSGDGEFKVKVIRNFIDDLFLPSSDVATRWVKFIPIKVNVFSWRARRDRLPTRVNLSRRGVLLDSHLCPLCNAAMEDVQHVFFRCDVARVVLRKICRWWDLDWQEICSFSDWDAWFLSLVILPSQVYFRAPPSSTSSGVYTRKPTSKSYKVSDGPLTISDFDRRTKKSNIDSTNADTPDNKPPSIGSFGHVKGEDIVEENHGVRESESSKRKRNEGDEVGDELERVKAVNTKEIMVKDLPRLTLDERLMAMSVIGRSEPLSVMFDQLDQQGKVRMAQMVAVGAIS